MKANKVKINVASYLPKRILPPANDVWGKVIFSQACVIPSVHKGEGGLAS